MRAPDHPELPAVEPVVRQRLLAITTDRGRRIRRARRRVLLRSTAVVIVLALLGIGGLYGARLVTSRHGASFEAPSTPARSIPSKPPTSVAPRVIAAVALSHVQDPTVSLPGIAASPVTGDGAVWVLAVTADHPLELLGIKGSPPAVFTAIQLLKVNDFAAAMGNHPPVSAPVVIGDDAWVVVPGELLEVNLTSGRIVRSTPDHHGTPQVLADEHGSLWRFENGFTPSASGATTFFPELQRIDLATGLPAQSIHLPGGCGGGPLVPGPQGLWAETLACGIHDTVHVDLIDPSTGQILRTLSYPVAHELTIEAASTSALWGIEYGPSGSTSGLLAVDPSNGTLLLTSSAAADTWGLGAAFGSSGLWSAGRRAVALIDPATGSVEHVITLPGGSLVDGITAGVHALWIRDAAGLIEVRPS